MIRKLFGIGSIIMIACLVLNGTELQADTKSKLLVQIKDVDGKPIPGVKVTIVSEKSAARSYTLETNEKGKATLSGVEPDMYDIKVEKEGYQQREGKLKLRIGIKVKFEEKLLTLDQAKATQIEQKWAGLSEEEQKQFKAKDAHNSGVEAFNAGNFQEAKKHFETAIELWPEIHFQDYFLLGQIAFDAKDVDTAIARLVKAQELDKNKEGTVDITRLLGACYLIKEDFAKVREVWGEYVTKEPDPTILYNLANIEIKIKDFPAAIKWLEVCREKNPEYMEALQLLGDLYIQINDQAKSLKVYEQYVALLEKDPNANPEVLKNAKDTVKLLKEMQRKK